MEIPSEANSFGVVGSMARRIRRPRIIIIGAGWAGQTIAQELIKCKRFHVIGFLDDLHEQMGPFEVMGHTLPVLGPTQNLLEEVERCNAKEIVVAITHERKDHLLGGIVECFQNEILVHQMPELYGRLTGKIPLKHIDSHWILPHMKEPERSIGNLLMSFMDYAMALVLFSMVFIPTFPLIALAIKKTSPGPVFFLQKRVGFRGRRFTILKYRTMGHKARSEGASWTTENDSRVTGLGAFLRKYRVDELPQLINVLRGDMALVGPRPEAVDLVSMYRKEIPFYQYRSLARPGITGWAQVKYKNTCSVDGALEKLQYDLYWIKRRSPLLHLEVMLKTVKVTLTGFGSV